MALYVTTQPYPNVWRDEKEKFYLNPSSGKKEAFPSINDDWSVHLSVIVPAYNEEDRCKNFLYKFYCLYFTYKLLSIQNWHYFKRDAF